MRVSDRGRGGFQRNIHRMLWSTFTCNRLKQTNKKMNASHVKQPEIFLSFSAPKRFFCLFFFKVKQVPTSVFLFLFIILSSVCFRSRIKEWFRCSSQRFPRSTCQDSRRTTAAGNTQHCRESNTATPKLGFKCAKHMWETTARTTSISQLQARLKTTWHDNLSARLNIYKGCNSSSRWGRR